MVKKSKATRRAEAATAAERAAAIRQEQERLERRRRTLAVSAAVLVVLVLIFGIGFALSSKHDTSGASGGVPANTTDTYGFAVGPASAKVTLDAYEDFMCPVCGDFEAASRTWVDQYVQQGKVRVVYHPIAFLDRMSNGTQYSTRAANALGVVLSTSGPDVAKKFHDLLYENQPQEGSNGLTDAQLIDLAVKAGAAKDKVEGPINSLTYKQWVANATDASSKAGVNGTPTVLVDGKPFTNWQTIQDLSTNLKQLVDSKQG